jgi:hypothetical protein
MIVLTLISRCVGLLRAIIRVGIRPIVFMGVTALPISAVAQDSTSSQSRDLSGDDVDDSIVADPETQSSAPGPGEVRLHSGQDGQLFTRLIGRIEGSRFEYDVPGDADGDADVDWDDVVILLSHLGLIADATAYQGDVNGDGMVSVTDLNVTLDHFGDIALDFGGVAGGSGEWIINPCDGQPIWQDAGSQLIFCCCAESSDCECPEVGISPPPGFDPRAASAG